MTLAYDTPAGKLVYDTAPDQEYDPVLLALRGLTPQRVQPEIDWARPHRLVSSAQGFGTTRRMLDTGAPPKHPWLTVPLAEQELAIGEYQRDRAQVALDSAK